jgi:hypothetical protein
MAGTQATNLAEPDTLHTGRLAVLVLGLVVSLSGWSGVVQPSSLLPARAGQSHSLTPTVAARRIRNTRPTWTGPLPCWVEHPNSTCLPLPSPVMGRGKEAN